MQLQLPDKRTFAPDRPVIMGILNVTPDSFSDGGRYAETQAAVAHGLEMARQGARLIDVGGESTRPGSQRVSAEEQIRRVVEVIGQLRGDLDAAAYGAEVVISIDTTRSPVAEAALEAGAAILNDVSAGGDDPAMLSLAASSGAPICLMHMQGAPATMQKQPSYDDVVSEVKRFLLDRAELAIKAGVPRERIILDPGIGFGKTYEHNLALLNHLDVLVDAGYPVLLGASRKKFMRMICESGETDEAGVLEPQQWVGATCATTVLGVMQGVDIFRVHDVRANRQAMDVAWALKRQGGPEEK